MAYLKLLALWEFVLNAPTNHEMSLCLAKGQNSYRYPGLTRRLTHLADFSCLLSSIQIYQYQLLFRALFVPTFNSSHPFWTLWNIIFFRFQNHASSSRCPHYHRRENLAFNSLLFTKFLFSQVYCFLGNNSMVAPSLPWRTTGTLYKDVLRCLGFRTTNTLIALD